MVRQKLKVKLILKTIILMQKIKKFIATPNVNVAIFTHSQIGDLWSTDWLLYLFSPLVYLIMIYVKRQTYFPCGISCGFL